jgi:hypothetical protein
MEAHPTKANQTKPNTHAPPDDAAVDGVDHVVAEPRGHQGQNVPFVLQVLLGLEGGVDLLGGVWVSGWVLSVTAHTNLKHVYNITHSLINYLLKVLVDRGAELGRELAVVRKGVDRVHPVPDHVGGPEDRLILFESQCEDGK